MTTETLEREELKLTPAKRLRLAEKLMDSVDDFATADIAKAWQAEITRRVEEIDNGTDPGILAEKVHAETRKRLRGARRVSSIPSMTTKRTNCLTAFLLWMTLAFCLPTSGADTPPLLSAPPGTVPRLLPPISSYLVETLRSLNGRGVLASEIKVCPDGHTTLRDVPIRYGRGWGTTQPSNEFEYWPAGCGGPPNPPSNRVTCTTCRLGTDSAFGFWSASAPSPAAFKRPFSTLIAGFPIPTTNLLTHPQSFTQTIQGDRLIMENLFFATKSPAATVSKQIDEWIRKTEPSAQRTESGTEAATTRVTSWKAGDFTIHLHQYGDGKTCGVSAMRLKLKYPTR